MKSQGIAKDTNPQHVILLKLTYSSRGPGQRNGGTSSQKESQQDNHHYVSTDTEPNLIVSSHYRTAGTRPLKTYPACRNVLRGSGLEIRHGCCDTHSWNRRAGSLSGNSTGHDNKTSTSETLAGIRQLAGLARPELHDAGQPNLRVCCN